MLYLLRSYIKDGSVLKVGYTGDYVKRFIQYQHHNPGIEEVAKKDGELEDETELHLYLHFLGYCIYGGEWYKDCQEVIDIFNMSSNELDRALWDNQDSIFLDKFKNDGPLILYKRLYESFENKEDIFTRPCYIEYLEYSLSKGSLNPDSWELSDGAKNVFNFFSTTKNFEERMSLVCSIYRESSDIFKECLIFMPSHYSEYIESLGVDVIKACSYKESEIKERIKVNSYSDQLRTSILAKFPIGVKLSLKTIKSTLEEIYKDLDIGKTPKATDLEEYFELKECKMTNKETGKRDRAYEIIKKK